MSSSRDAILKRLRNNQPNWENSQVPGSYLRPERNREERVSRFCEKMTSVKGEIHQVKESDWVEKLKQLAQEKQISNLLYGANTPIAEEIVPAWSNDDALPQLITRDAPTDEWKSELFNEIDASITSVRSAIADTGTLVLWPTPEEPRTFSLVPSIHFALMRTSTLHNTFADLIETERWHKGLPTNALLISGPSKSADIEQNLVYGVHGPMQLTILMIMD